MAGLYRQVERVVLRDACDRLLQHLRNDAGGPDSLLEGGLIHHKHVQAKKGRARFGDIRYGLQLEASASTTDKVNVLFFEEFESNPDINGIDEGRSLSFHLGTIPKAVSPQ